MMAGCGSLCCYPGGQRAGGVSCRRGRRASWGLNCELYRRCRSSVSSGSPSWGIHPWALASRASARALSAASRRRRSARSWSSDGGLWGSRVSVCSRLTLDGGSLCPFSSPLLPKALLPLLFSMVPGVEPRALYILALLKDFVLDFFETSHKLAGAGLKP